MNDPLPASWSKPVAAWFAALDAAVRQASDDRAAFLAAQKAIARIPDVLNEMDVAALADWFETALGGYAAAGALASKLAGPAPKMEFLSAEPFDFGVKLAPFAEAVTRLDFRRPVGAALRSWEWEQVPRELRERAQFSAGVESVQLLNEIQERVRRRLAIETEKLGNGRERFENRDTFISEVRDLAKALGVDTTRGAGDYGTIRDITSNPRLALIYEMQTSQAAEYARRKADLSGVALNMYPAYRFERVETRERPRGEAYWQNRWSEAGSAVGWEGASERPMVALKTSPIWAALSRFGNPHPPFDYGSGMGTVDVDRDTAVRLGLLKDAEKLEATPEDFNDGLTASAQGVAPELLEKLRGMLGDAVEIRGDEVRWAGVTGEMPPPFVEAPLFQDPAAREIYGAAANDVARMAKWLASQRNGEYLVAIKPSGILYDRPVKWTRDPLRVTPPATDWGIGKHLLHNHPLDKGSGRSFSAEDVASAFLQKPASMTVAFRGGAKTLIAPNGWPKSQPVAVIEDRYDGLQVSQAKRLIYANRNGTIPDEGLNEGIADATWKAFAEEKGLQYKALE